MLLGSCHELKVTCTAATPRGSNTPGKLTAEDVNEEVRRSLGTEGGEISVAVT